MGQVIGLLGGVASGKSTVARRLAAAGCLVLDADAEARAVTSRPEVLEALVGRFGAQILGSDGSLDRAALATTAFADAASTAALNAIVHPAVRRALVAGLDAAGDRPVVLDVPLLLESPLAERVTTWIFLATDEGDRELRARDRGWSPGERERREAAQADLDAKRSQADHVLENRGTIEDLEAQVDALLAEWGLPSTAPQRPEPGS